jgi:hypothetical protein
MAPGINRSLRAEQPGNRLLHHLLRVWRGEHIEWDVSKLRATNCPEADAVIHKTIGRGMEFEKRELRWYRCDEKIAEWKNYR